MVYLPASYTGSGFAESCLQIITQFRHSDIRVILVVARLRKPVDPNIEVVQALPFVFRHTPWKFTFGRQRYMGRALRRTLKKQDPVKTIVYFWPSPEITLVEDVRRSGFIAVREMINSPMETARLILERAYHAQGLTPTRIIDEERAAQETAELKSYDRIFASNPEVEATLSQLGIQRDRIMPTTFGWSPQRLRPPQAEAPPTTTGEEPTTRPLRVLFLGLLTVRKGLPQLLAAWEAAGIDGELILAGAAEPALANALAKASRTGSIKCVGPVSNPSKLYESSDVFVLPTLEEGGPQVTYEAAAFGLPIVTTPMGAARLVVDGRSGLIVPPFDVERLTTALQLVASEPSLRQAMGVEAQRMSADFTYESVGAGRAGLLLSALDRGHF
ncbi:glycosyltransferase [Modestobacter sp. VKM Ac-2979]|uniref:glycosyltransferase n=1 Tax=unclassified Modestobacter TaxID=2643866 RepID=UPI0022AB54D5|nr:MULTISPECIES: glycosyltransferase [unclassified Modestobacter]MCZ2813429.1 glycosyltransferase [Modestobacter sp. VKM Ac-2979]MCZ2842379.1 glycosyltransferase [Modestobacter sp. VKM Ac-2980]